MQGWLPENDLVYFVLDTVNQLDISAITEKYEQEKRGYPPYNPRMMVALLFYAYCRGIYSSRKIMAACEERLTFRVITGDDIPDFRTISDFRKLHIKELADLFIGVLQLCQKAGLVKLGHIALDSTKVKANASRHKAMSYGRMKREEKRLKEEIDQLLSKAESVDQQEDQQYGSDCRGDEYCTPGLNSGMPPLFKVGTQCGNSARWGLYGGRRVIGVPTVTGSGLIRYILLYFYRIID